VNRYPGIFMAATNLMGRIEAAAPRRFDFKLNFRALSPNQRLRLFDLLPVARAHYLSAGAYRAVFCGTRRRDKATMTVETLIQ
jgi:hypothetical protein